MDLLWREAGLADLSRIGEIADSVHVTLPERQEVFADKINSSPQTSLVLVAGEAIVGYALCHLWERYRIPQLDALLGTLAGPTDCLYVHDVVVLPEFRGKQAVASAIQLIAQIAHSKGIRYLALVSVYNTVAMWERLGFCVVDADSGLATKLLSYGDTAKYMIRDLEHQA